MIGTPTRVAVAAGAATVRLAAAERGREPQLLAEVPARGDRCAQVRELLSGLVAGPPDELLVVGGAAPSGPGWGPARVVRPVPAGTAAGHGPRLVVDVGHSGAELTVVDADGRAVLVRRAGAGGARLDAAVAALLGGVPDAVARRVREAVSLLPSATAALPGGAEVGATAADVRAVLAPLLDEIVGVARECGSAAPVLLVGGVARTPLLAELFDVAGLGTVTVAARPEAAAVVGALRLPPAALARVAPGPAAAGVEPDRRWLAPPPPRRHPAVRAAPAVLAAAAVATVVVPGGATPAVVAAPAGVVAQYGYVLRLPEGWTHAGGLPERRRTLLTPAGAPDGSDVVVVERTPLGYDAASEPGRAAAELRAAFDAAVAAGAPLSGFEPEARHADRAVAVYREHGAGGVIDWYVLLDGPDQLTVGCQHTGSGVVQVRRACATVVGSLRPG